MGRDEDSSGPQPFLDLIAETIRVAEDTIVVENAAVGVAESRPDESDRIGSVNLEAAGITVDTVAQFVGSGQYFSRYSSRTGRLLYTLETVPRATPASAATSFIVGAVFLFGAIGLLLAR